MDLRLGSSDASRAPGSARFRAHGRSRLTTTNECNLTANEECKCRLVQHKGLPRCMRGESEGSEGKRKRHDNTAFIWPFLSFVGRYLKGPARRCTTRYMTTLTTDWESARGPDENRDHILESSLTGLVPRWVPEDDVGDARGGDGMLGPESRGRASS